MKTDWLFRGLLFLNVCAWSALGWQKWKSHQSAMETEAMSRRLRYWTDQTQCDIIFGYGINSGACKDRVAALHDRSAEWEKEKEAAEQRADALIKQAESLP